MQFFDAAWINFPLFVSAVLLVLQWVNPSTRGFARKSSLFLGAAIIFGVLILKGGMTSGGVVLLAFLGVLGPWLFLFYLIFGGLVAASSHSTTTDQTPLERGAEHLRSGDVSRWRNHVMQCNSAGFSSTQIEENLVSRGVSENDAKVIVSLILRENLR